MEKLEFDIECPNCHRTIRVRVEDMRPGKSTKCSSCGTILEFTGDDGRKIQKSLDDLERTIVDISL